jgi:hypothetical protein
MKTKSIGDKFRSLDGDTYILAQTAPYKVSLINLNSGNRYHDAVEVKNIFKITSREWTNITLSPREFKKI